MTKEIVKFVTYIPNETDRISNGDELTDLYVVDVYHSFSEAKESAHIYQAKVAKVTCTVETDYQEPQEDK